MEKIVFKNESLKLEFRLSIVNYQFPDKQSDYDGNWLMLKYECYYRDKKFVVEDPSILTSELKGIYNWFNNISQNRIPWSVSLGFLEPNLRFILYSNKNDIIRFGIQLDLEAKPPFNIEEYTLEWLDDEENEFIMFFESSFEELKKYSDSFLELCNEYPLRGDF